ncbi:MAG: hypothetical protein Phog2KO_00410 [Phototrophicaceae bacterium]
MTLIKSHDARAIITLIILWMIFFWRILTPIPEDQASFKQGDFSGQFVAFGAYQYERMSQGEIPLWNPYNNGGLPFIADTQAAVFYPPRLITIALASLAGGWSYYALELEAILHVLLYSLLMYAFVRRLTGSVWGAFVSAIIVSYGGFVSGYPPLQLALLEASVWLPLSALCILKATEHEKIRWVYIVLAGFVLGVSWLAGHPQTSWFMTYLLVAWLAYRVYEQHYQWRMFFIGVSLMGVITVGTTAVTLLSGIDYLLQTARSGFGYDAKGNGFPFQDVIQFIVPSSVSAFSPLYVGIPALILIFIASWYCWKKSRFWFIIAVISLLWSFGANSVVYPILYNLLFGLRYFRGQERSAFLVANSLAILSGIGMAHLATWASSYDEKPVLRFMNVLLGLIISLTLLIYVAWWGNIGEGFGQLISLVALSAMVISVAWAFVMWQIRRPQNLYALPLICLLIVFELFSVNMDASSNYDSIPASQQLSLEAPDIIQTVLDSAPETPYRVDGFRGVQANYGSLYQLQDIRGISPLFLDSPFNIIYRDYVNNPRAWEIFAVRYVFSERDSFGQVDTSVLTQGIDRDGQVFVHELDNPRPFAHLVYDVALVGGDEHAIELLYDPNFPVRDTVILQTEPSLTLPDASPTNTEVTITDFAPESITIELNTPENAILSLALVDYSGWKATLNDSPVEILRAYGSLSALEIPSGQHTVRLSFEPLPYRIGAIMSLLTWGFVLIMSLIFIFNRQSNQELA